MSDDVFHLTPVDARRYDFGSALRGYDKARVDRIIEVSQQESEAMARRLAAEEGIFAGISSGGGLAAAMQVSAEAKDAIIVHIVCDRGDRYLSTGVFPA